MRSCTINRIRQSLEVSWTYEITVDDLYSEFYLQNYIHVTKIVLKCQKVPMYDDSTSQRSQVRLSTESTWKIPG